MTDDDLIRACFDEDLGLAAMARRIYAERHRNDPQPAEPPHCSECFEGCPKCELARTRYRIKTEMGM